MLISVVIPVRNRTSLIERTLHSIRSQTHRPIDLVVVDNGSTDNTPTVVQEWIGLNRAADFEVRLLQEPRPGASMARNTGLAAAHGSWVSFFDSDDEMSPTFLSDTVKAVQGATEECQLCTARVMLVDAQGHPHPKQAPHSLDPALQILTGWLSTQAFVVRTDFIRHLGGWNSTLQRWQDWELGLRLLLAHPHTMWLPHRYHRVYAHSNSITGRDFASALPALLSACTTARRDIDASNVPQAEKKRLYRALSWRMLLLAAWMHREGAPQAAHRALQVARNLPYPPSGTMARLLYHYTAIGGRGAWHLARHLL